MSTRLATVSLLALIFASACGGCGEENNGDFDMGPEDMATADAADAGIDEGVEDMPTTEDVGNDVEADAGDDMQVDMAPPGPLAFGGILPATSPVEGGVTITIRGDNFTADTAVQVDGEDADDVTLVDAQTLTFTSPTHEPGDADVTLVRGQEMVTFGEPLSYQYYPGPSGGAIADSVQVRVIQGNTTPLQDAFVMLGTDPSTANQGFTDADGLIEFSGIGAGAVTVVAAAAGHSSSMIVDVDAQFVSLSLKQLGAGDPMMDPGPTATVSGAVMGFDMLSEPGADQSRQARVVTTQRFSSNPDPGDENSADETDGTYTATTRIGEQRPVAFGGIVDDNTGDFTPEQMGLGERILPTTDEAVEEANIALDIPLDQTLEIEFADDPTIFGTDFEYLIQPYVDLGFEGKVALPARHTAGTTITIDTLPALSGELEDATIELRVTVDTPGGPRVVPNVRVLDVTDLSTTLQIAMTAERNITMPGGGTWSDTVQWELVGTQEPDHFDLTTLNPMTVEPDWRVVLPATARSMTFPTFPDFSGEPPERQPDPYPSGSYLLALSGLIVPNFDYDAFGFPGLTSPDFIGTSTDTAFLSR